MTDQQELVGVVFAGDLDGVKFYIECGVPPEYELLHVASERGHAEIVRYLINLYGPDQRSAAVNSFGDPCAYTPLTHAANNGHLGIMQLLLEAGADVNAHDESQIGNTVLREVVMKASVEVVATLLDAGRIRSFLAGCNLPHTTRPWSA